MTDPLAIIMDLPLVSTIVDDATLGKQYRAVFAVHGKAIEALQTAPQKAHEAAGHDYDQLLANELAEAAGKYNVALGRCVAEDLVVEADYDATGITLKRVVVPERVLVG